MTVTKHLRVLSVSTDREIFREGSEANLRMKDHASVLDEFHIIIFAKSSLRLKKTQIAPNAWAYPTNSFSRWFYISGALRVARDLFPFSSDEKKALDLSPTDPAVNLVTSQDPFECGLAAYFISKGLRAPLQIQIHTDFLDPHFAKGSFLNAIRVRIGKFLLRSRADLRVVSERIKFTIMKKMRFPGDRFPRITVMPVFVDVGKFRNLPENNMLQQKFPGNDLIVLMVGRLEKEKNFDLGVTILALAKKKNPEAFISLVILGEGSQKESLRELARSLLVSDRVYFEGAVSDPGPYYRSADVLLVTSHYEGYGRMFIEAVASGCPVITKDVGAAKEILTRSNGIVCEEGDEECLLHNVLLFGGNHLVRDQFKNAARVASGKYEPKTKERYLSEYRDMLQKAAENEAYRTVF